MHTTTHLPDLEVEGTVDTVLFCAEDAGQVLSHLAAVLAAAAATGAGPPSAIWKVCEVFRVTGPTTQGPAF